MHSYFDQKLPGYTAETHGHNTVELFCVVGGKARYTFMDEGRPIETVLLKPGDLILIDAGHVHRLAAEDGCRALFLELRALPADGGAAYVDGYTAFNACGALSEAFKKNKYVLVNDFMSLKETVLKLQALVNSDRLRYIDHYFTQILIAELFLSIDECYKKTLLENPYVHRITDYITRSYQEELTIRRIAKAVSLNETYLQKIFRKETGFTVFEYVTQYRINQSIALMRNTGLKFADIAAEVGFANRQSFYNAFMEFTGYTPKLFRKFLTFPVSDYSASHVPKD
ncbi:MAG: AraC family transcriptional regulator [Clostridiales bacterium]|nr:AraC family transcriptional regulator [Clostridiales bacterium]